MKFYIPVLQLFIIILLMYSPSQSRLVSSLPSVQSRLPSQSVLMFTISFEKILHTNEGPGIVPPKISAPKLTDKIDVFPSNDYQFHHTITVMIHNYKI